MEPCLRCKGVPSAPSACEAERLPCCDGVGWVQPEYDGSPGLEVALDAALYAEVRRAEEE